MQDSSKLLVAGLVLRHHPDDAAAYALARIDELRAEGDIAGEQDWRDILDTVRSFAKPRASTTALTS